MARCTLLSVVGHTCNPSTWETEVILAYRMRLCLIKKVGGRGSLPLVTDHSFFTRCGNLRFQHFGGRVGRIRSWRPVLATGERRRVGK